MSKCLHLYAMAVLVNDNLLEFSYTPEITPCRPDDGLVWTSRNNVVCTVRDFLNECGPWTRVGRRQSRDPGESTSSHNLHCLSQRQESRSRQLN